MFESIVFEVVGDQKMVCESCERRVERMLKGLDGVSKVHAHSQNQRIEVLVDTALLERDAVVERLATAGYDAKAASA